MPWAIAGAVLGAGITAYGSKSAANTQAASADKSSQTQKDMFDQTTKNVAPWLQSGQSSLARLTAGTQPGGEFEQTGYTPFTMDQYHESPGYQFQLQQGLNTLTNRASIGGGMNSNNLKGMLGYSQGLASQDYQTQMDNYMRQFQLQNQIKQQNFSNVSGMSSLGLGAGLQQGQIGANVGQSIGSNIIGAGNAQAAGQIGVGNAITGGIGQGYNAWLQNRYMGNSGTSGYGAGAFSGWGNGAGSSVDESSSNFMGPMQ